MTAVSRHFASRFRKAVPAAASLVVVGALTAVSDQQSRRSGPMQDRLSTEELLVQAEATARQAKVLLDRFSRLSSQQGPSGRSEPKSCAEPTDNCFEQLARSTGSIPDGRSVLAKPAQRSEPVEQQPSVARAPEPGSDGPKPPAVEPVQPVEQQPSVARGPEPGSDGPKPPAVEPVQPGSAGSLSEATQPSGLSSDLRRAREWMRRRLSKLGSDRASTAPNSLGLETLPGPPPWTGFAFPETAPIPPPRPKRF